MRNIFNEIKSAERIAIFAHAKTDGDAVGASLALFYYCKSQKKEVSVHIDSDIPQNLNFLDGVSVINKGAINKGDLAIVVDCADVDRLGRNRFKLSKFKTVINVDHHDNANFGHLRYIKPEYSSTCELIYDLFCQFGEEVTPLLARYLVCGILTDTGGLRFSNVTSETLIKVAKLLQTCNANINDFMGPLFSSITPEMFNLKKYAFENIKLIDNGKIAIITIQHQTLTDLGVMLTDTKVVLEIGLSLANNLVMVAITEGEPGVNYVSFRTKNRNIDGSSMAAQFGGGGHKMASGCKLYCSISEAEEKVYNVVKSMVGNL